MKNIRLSRLSDCLVFFDFDNTITPFDVLDDIISKFAIDNKWVTYERNWEKGKIGSLDCIKGQLKSIRVSKEGLRSYLAGIKIDPYFHEVIDLLKRDGLKPIILSDSFNFIIDTILRHNGVKEARIYANGLKFNKNRLSAYFPNTNRHCIRCAHCKKKNLLKNGIRDKIIMYVGDGLSDICPAECSDIVFAKGRLLEHCRRTKRLCIAFRDLRDIYNYFRGLGK